MVDSVASQGIELINNLGFLDIVVRFILGFAITYGILEKTAIFGNGMEKINLAIAACVGIVAVLAFN